MEGGCLPSNFSKQSKGVTTHARAWLRAENRKYGTISFNGLLPLDRKAVFLVNVKVISP